MPMDKTMERNLADLESLLRQQLELHEQLVSLLHAKRAALAGANHRQVTDLCVQENKRVQAVSELEKRRLVLVAQMTLALDPQAPQPLRLKELAERLPEPARGRLLVLRQQVHARMGEAQREIGIARRASELLVRHMQGIIQTIGAAVTGVGTYNRTGGRPKIALAMSTFNTTA